MGRMVRLGLIGWLMLAGFAAAAGTRVLPPGTPVFSRPLHTAPLVTVCWEAVHCQDDLPQTVLIKKHPLARYYTFVPVTLPDGRSGYVDPAVHVELRADGPHLCFASARTWWKWLLAGGCLAAGWGLVMAHRRRLIPGWIAWGSYPVWLHLSLISVVTLAAGNLVTSPMDENGYFANLQAVMAGNWTDKWHFSVGLSLLYVPFAMLSRAVAVDDFLIAFSYFSALILTSGRLFAAYLIGRKLLRSDRRSAVAAGLWAVMPFLVHHYAGFADRSFYSYLALPSVQFDFSHYVMLIGAGFNAMSDNPSTLLLLAAMVAVLYTRPGRWAALTAGWLFGWACMVRCNSILYAPVLMMLAGWDQPLREWCRCRNGWAAGLGFLLGFAPQAVVNTWFFGAPWRFSYTDYANGAHTYCAWIFGDLNAAYYGAANHYPWLLGALGIWLIRDARLRTLLMLWFWPTVLLFLFYSHGTDDAVRFILPTYPAMLLAFAGGWPSCRDRRAWLAAVLLFSAVLLIPPGATGGSWRDVGACLLARGRWLPPGMLIGVAVMLTAAGWLWKSGERRLAGLLPAALILQLWGNSYILILLLAGAGVYSVIHFMIQMRHGSSRSGA